MSDTVTRLNAALEGRYRIERELGEGGMATVYLADDLKHERQVALKVLKPELAAVVGADRFLAEIKTTANLQHPHILPLHDSGEADSFLFYVMPYIQGETLRDRLERDKQLPVDEAVRMAVDVAEALHAAHQQGVIHRDVKPANVFLVGGELGRPKVLDFGVALPRSEQDPQQQTQLVGTPNYMSPEQVIGKDLDARTDLFSAGIVLYEMLAMNRLFHGKTELETLMLVRDCNTKEAVERLPAGVSEDLKAILERALHWLDKTGHLHFGCFRYFNAAGATAERGEDHTPELHLIPLVIQAATGKRDAITIFGDDYDTPDGTCVRDYIHVCDLADAHVLAIGAIVPGQVKVYNLGNGEGFSVREVIETCREVTGHAIPAEVAPRRPGDPPRLIASSDKIRTELGWAPKFQNIQPIVESAWAWHLRNPQGYGA